jgi:hypothetical protein
MRYHYYSTIFLTKKFKDKFPIGIGRVEQLRISHIKSIYTQIVILGKLWEYQNMKCMIHNKIRCNSTTIITIINRNIFKKVVTYFMHAIDALTCS